MERTLSCRDDPQIITCPYVLVTDDAEFLVLVMDYALGTALRIYRRREHPGQRLVGPWPDTGVFIKAIPLDAIIPPPPPGEIRMIADHTRSGTPREPSPSRTIERSSSRARP